MSYDLTDEQLRAIYAWIDAIPLSRPKRNIARDFSDGVMLAEVRCIHPNTLQTSCFANSPSLLLFDVPSLFSNTVRTSLSYASCVKEYITVTLEGLTVHYKG